MSTFNSKSIFQFASKSDIIKIILVVTILFVLFQFIRISMLMTSNDATPFYQYIWNKLSLPSNIKTFLHQPWSLITFFFLDESFWGIIGNMIWLWIFGSVIEDLKGPNRIFPVFFIGGIVGGIFMLILGLLKPTSLVYLSGASCSVIAVAFAALIFKPSYKFWMLFGVGIPIWVFVMIFVGIRLASIGLHNLPDLFLLLGGLAVGLGYNNILSTFFDKCTNLLRQSGTIFDNKNFVLKKTTSRDKDVHAIPYKRVQFTPSRIDELLDKINEKGINSLTKEERQFLDDYSRSKK
jgi:membrane associated rhomboid family serine protease